MTTTMKFIIGFVVAGVALLILLFIFLAIYFKRRKVTRLILVLGPNNVVCKRIKNIKAINEIPEPTAPAGYRFDSWSDEPIGYTSSNLPVELPRVKNTKILYAKWINIKDNDTLATFIEEKEECQESLNEKQAEHNQLNEIMNKEKKELAKQVIKGEKAVANLQKAVVAEEKARQDVELKAQIAAEATRAKEEVLQKQIEERKELAIMQEEVATMRKEANTIIATAKEDLAMRKAQIQQEKEELKTLLKTLREQLALQNLIQNRQEEKTAAYLEDLHVTEEIDEHTKEAEIKGDSFDDKK